MAALLECAACMRNLAAAIALTVQHAYPGPCPSPTCLTAQCMRILAQVLWIPCGCPGCIELASSWHADACTAAAGLDARAAAVVMRTVRAIVSTGRTICCTIHQVSTPGSSGQLLRGCSYTVNRAAAATICMHAEAGLGAAVHRHL